MRCLLDVGVADRVDEFPDEEDQGEGNAAADCEGGDIVEGIAHYPGDSSDYLPWPLSGGELVCVAHGEVVVCGDM